MTIIKTASVSGDLVLGNYVSAVSSSVLEDSGIPVGGGGSSTTLAFQIAGKYFSNQAVSAVQDTPEAIKFDTSNQSTANVTLTSETDLTFVTVGLYFAKFYSYASMPNNTSAYTGAVYAEVTAGAANISFLEGVETGLAGQANQGRVIDTYIPINVTSPNTVIKFYMSQRTGTPANTPMTLKTFNPGTNTPAVPSASIEIWKEITA